MFKNIFIFQIKMSAEFSDLPEDVFYHMTKSGFLNKTDINKLGSVSKYYSSLEPELISTLEKQLENFKISFNLKIDTVIPSEIRNLLFDYLSPDLEFDFNWEELLPVGIPFADLLPTGSNLEGLISINGKRNKYSNRPFGEIKIQLEILITINGKYTQIKLDLSGEKDNDKFQGIYRVFYEYSNFPNVKQRSEIIHYNLGKKKWSIYHN